MPGPNATGSCSTDRGFRPSSTLCQACLDGWHRSVYSGCVRCSEGGSGHEKGRATALLFFGIVAFFAGFVILVALKVKKYAKAKGFNRDRRRKAPHSTLKRIILSHMQTLSLVMGLAVPWPQLMLDFAAIISSASSLSENAYGLECLIAGEIDHASVYYGLLYTINFFPLVFVAILALYWLLLVPYCHGNKYLTCGVKLRHGSLALSASEMLGPSQNPSPRGLGAPHEGFFFFVPTNADTFVSSMVLFWYLMLPSLVRIGTGMFECRYIGAPPSSVSSPKHKYLAVAMDEICWENRHLYNATCLALPMLVMYAIIVPVAIMLRLHRASDARLNSPSLMMRWGFLHSGCKFFGG